MMDWSEVVPEFTLRQVQRDVLDQVGELFEAGKKTVLVEAPPGVGKSIILLALARSYGPGYIVTPQLVLQDQLGTLPGVAVVKGRSAYFCGLTNESAVDAPCTIGPRPNGPECTDKECAYYGAIARASGVRVVAHSYASLMAQARGGHFGQRPLLALDECHTAAQWVRSANEIKVTKRQMAMLSDNLPKKVDDVLKWLAVYAAVIEPTNIFDIDLRSVISRLQQSPEVFGVPALTAGHCSIDDLMAEPHRPQCEFITEYDRYTETVKIRPLKSGPFGRSLLGLGTRVVAASATIINVPMLAAELGLKPSDVASVTSNYSFNSSNRRIVRQYVGSVSSKTEDSVLPRLCEAIVGLAEQHSGQRGMIHVPSYQLTSKLTDVLRNRLPGRIIKLSAGSKRNETIQSFISGEAGGDAILVGPGLVEGIDGVDDVLRWQVIVKIPWPSLADPLVTHLREAGRDALADRWIKWKAIQATVQAVGRVCRHETDFGVTYVLDSGFDKLIDGLPQYVLDAIT